MRFFGLRPAAAFPGIVEDIDLCGCTGKSLT